MDNPQQSVALGSQKTTWKEGQPFPSYYANLIGFSMSPFDITLLFGELDTATPTEIIGLPRAKILLSPEQAQNLMKLLVLAVEAFQKNNGALRTNASLNIAELQNQLTK